MVKIDMTKIERKLQDICDAFKIIVNDDGVDVELEAPQGHCFEPGLHYLVTSPWDAERRVHVLHRAIDDARVHGPHIERCDDPDCDQECFKVWQK